MQHARSGSETATPRALVAVSSAAQPTVRNALGHCEAEFVASYADAAALLGSRPYALVVVGLHFGESRLFDFINVVRAARPSARIVTVMGEETQLSREALAGVRTALNALNVDGLVDLTHPLCSERDLQAVARIRRHCGERGLCAT